MIGEFFRSVDSSFAWLLNDQLRLVIWASTSGILSMLLYKLTSPQSRIRELDAEAADIRKSLAAYDGEFAEALPLLRSNLVIALKRLRAAFAPALLSGLPILLCLVGLDAVFHDTRWIPFGPSWLGWWVTGYLTVSTVSAVTVKVALRLK